MYLAKSSLSTAVVFILSCTAIAFALILFIKQQVVRPARVERPYLGPGDVGVNKAPPTECQGMMMQPEAVKAENTEEEYPSADGGEKEDGDDASDKERGPCASGKEGGKDAEELARYLPLRTDVNDFTYSYEPLSPIYKLWRGFVQELVCPKCNLAREKPGIFGWFSTPRRFQQLSDKTVEGFFHLLSTKIYCLIRLQARSGHADDSPQHNIKKFYFDNQEFKAFISDYHKWAGSRHKKVFITVEKLERLRALVDRHNYDSVSPKVGRFFHRLVLCRNVHCIGEMVCQAAEHRLDEACCPLFDDLFELFYRLAHDEAELASEDMVARGELAFLIYPLHVKIMKPFIEDNRVLFDPTAHLKLGSVLEYYSDLELRQQHNTTRLEVAMHALYFTVKKVLDLRSSEDMPSRRRCSVLLDRIMNGAEPAESVFEEVRRDIVISSDNYDPCAQAVVLTPLGMGFIA